MDRRAFASCFAAVALALLIFYALEYVTTPLVSAVILALVALLLVAFVTEDGRIRRRRR